MGRKKIYNSKKEYYELNKEKFRENARKNYLKKKLIKQLKKENKIISIPKPEPKPKKEPVKKRSYINDIDLKYEIILSKGKGYATKKLKLMLYKICYRLNEKFYYTNDDDRYDIMMDSYVDVMRKWIGYNEIKYNKALPYITEIAKRSHANHFNISKSKGMTNFDGPIVSINEWY